MKDLTEIIVDQFRRSSPFMKIKWKTVSINFQREPKAGRIFVSAGSGKLGEMSIAIAELARIERAGHHSCLTPKDKEKKT